MEEILDTLIKIQKLDDDIKEATNKIDAIPAKIKILEQQIAEANKSLEEKTKRMQEIRKTYKIKEGDIAENENKIKKLNSQTFAVKTNEEYRAILNEVDFLKKENKRIEDEMLGLLEEEEKLKATIKEFESETRELIQLKTAEINGLKKHNDDLVIEFDKLKIDFDNSFAKLPKNVQEQYQKIQKVRGNAVCLISDETCTGCYANITPQLLNELKKRNELLLCDSCGRILVYVEPNNQI
jgi:predicted  nucleic acid-binding Zn-ribbon protein